MKLSDYKGEEALDVLADIIEPLTAIFADEEFQELTKQKGTPAVKYVKPMIKNHKKELIEVLARLENKPVEEYKQGLTLMTLPLQVLEFINDPEIQNLFHSQSQTEHKPSASTGSAPENTEAKKN